MNEHTWMVIFALLSVVLLVAAMWTHERGQHWRTVAEANQRMGEAARRELGVLKDDRDWWRRRAMGNEKNAARPARITLEGGMGPEAIADVLRGTHALPSVRAIVDHIGAKIVAKADTATDAPRETQTLPDRILAGYSAEMRLHDAGMAAGAAEILSELQELTAAKAEDSATNAKEREESE